MSTENPIYLPNQRSYINYYSTDKTKRGLFPRQPGGGFGNATRTRPDIYSIISNSHLSTPTPNPGLATSGTTLLNSLSKGIKRKGNSKKSQNKVKKQKKDNPKPKNNSNTKKKTKTTPKVKKYSSQKTKGGKNLGIKKIQSSNKKRTRIPDIV